MPSFIENIRAVNQNFPYLLSTIQGRSEQGEASTPQGTLYKNLPNTNEQENSIEWRERIAVPFSFTKEGSKMYGMLYMPESEAANKLDPQRDINTALNVGDIQIYGGETMDGRSFTPKGFNEIVQEADKDSFKIENRLVDYLGGASARKYSKSGRPSDETVYRIPGIKVNDTKLMNALQQNLGSAQANQSNRNSSATNEFVNNYRTARGMNR